MPFLVSTGHFSSGLFLVYTVNGTTGEGVSLTDEERKQIAKEWLKVAGKRYQHRVITINPIVSIIRMTVIIHVGSMSLKSTCDLVTIYFHTLSVFIIIIIHRLYTLKRAVQLQ